MKRLFLSSLGVNLLARIINLATGILSARLLGPFGRGELAAATRWTSLFTLLFALGLPGAVIFLGKRSPGRQREYFGAYLILGTVIGLVGLVAGEWLAPELFSHQPTSVMRLAQIAMLSLPFGLLSDGLIGTLQTKDRFTQVMVLRVVGESGTLVLILALIVLGEYGVIDFVIGNTAWAAGTFFITMLMALHAVRPSIRNLWRNNVTLFRKGVKIYGSAIARTVSGNLDQLVISLLLTPYALGLYSVAASIGGILPSLLSGAISVYLWPKLMDMSATERIHRIERIHSSLFYGTLMLCLTAGASIPLLLPLMYGRQYIPAVLITEMCLLAAPVNIGYMVLTYLHSTNDRFHVITLAEIVGLGVGIAVTIPLLHVWAGPGAALGVLIALIVKWIWVSMAARRDGLAWHRLFKIYTDTLLSLCAKMGQLLRAYLVPTRLLRQENR